MTSRLIVVGIASLVLAVYPGTSSAQSFGTRSQWTFVLRDALKFEVPDITYDAIRFAVCARGATISSDRDYSGTLPLTGVRVDSRILETSGEKGYGRLGLRGVKYSFDDGRLGPELCRVYIPPTYASVAEADNTIRRDTTLEALASLTPVFDRKYGTVTAGNSSPLTDGASAVLMMSEDKARSLGYRPLVTIRGYAVAAVDPGWQLLMGPAYAVPKALDRAGISWKELGLVEIHEAFAAQVLSNVQAWGSKAWAERLGRPQPVGEVDWNITNVMGGSIAIGHPFGATGARLVTTLANEMQRRAVQFGLISICAQGGMGLAMVLEQVA